MKTELAVALTSRPYRGAAGRKPVAASGSASVYLAAAAPTVSAEFWSATLNLLAEPNRDTFVLRGQRPYETVWLNLVPEAKQGKTRVHLDLNLLSLQEVMDRGATVIDDSKRRTVCRAPDGVEFCAFIRSPQEMAGRRPLYEVVIDCTDPGLVCRWWANALGLRADRDPHDGSWWIDAAEEAGLGFAMVFGPVPEPKTVPNWVHWDVIGETAELIDAGATLLRARDDEIDWDVLADPAGNEFCVFTG